MGRALVPAILVLAAFGSWALAAEPELSFRLERAALLTSPAEFFYFQSRGALIPGNPAKILVTTQATDPGATHGYRDVFQIESTDRGETWSPPARVDSLRRIQTADGYDRVPGDLCPQWHAATRVVLATGKTFGFRGGTKEDRSLEQVSYAVYVPKTGTWGPMRILALPSTDHAGRPIVAPNSGCCQRFDLPNGEILLPVRYCPEKLNRPYATIVALCRFDGQTLSYVRHGTELSVPRGRGLYEPSITGFQGRFYLTLRADDSAYVARSDDGLNYEPPVEWKFDDGKPLGSYNTQQHWVAHGDALFLGYTRRGSNNDQIFRHRAPLFMARVDPRRLCVVRATEQELMPQEQAALGNFGVLDVSPRETWVIDSEQLAAGARRNGRGRVLAAKILWSRPNRAFAAGDPQAATPD
jgi:hypothetical protein